MVPSMRRCDRVVDEDDPGIEADDEDALLGQSGLGRLDVADHHAGRALREGHRIVDAHFFGAELGIGQSNLADEQARRAAVGDVRGERNLRAIVETRSQRRRVSAQCFFTHRHARCSGCGRRLRRASRVRSAWKRAGRRWCASGKAGWALRRHRRRSGRRRPLALRGR